MTDTAIYWIRNDLRFHDNETLVRALDGYARVLLVYIIDLRLFEQLPGLPFRKTGVHRAAFMLQSVRDFRARAQELGSDLAVLPTIAPAEVLRDLADRTGATTIYTQAEIGTEEQSDEAAVDRALGSKGKLVRIWGKSLYHPEELPFPAQETPEPFREFRRIVEKLTVRKPYPSPGRLPSIDNFDYPATPNLAQLGFKQTANPAYPGGESAGLARLNYYLEESHLIQRYRSTRNRSLGPDYSTKFSPYLALGCLSPRTIYYRIQEYHELHKKGAGNGVLFEMRWRDFFLCLGLKHGSRLFHPGGYKERKHEWDNNLELLQKWMDGQTGIPFVDAHMRQLEQTGFMSNRGRVNCSSFLTRDYQIDWRWGAAWFENRLVDYEVCANWFNWHTQALEIYYTSPPWQGLKYDKTGEYVKTWLPELANLPAPLLHAPWKWKKKACWTTWTSASKKITSAPSPRTANGTGPGAASKPETARARAGRKGESRGNRKFQPPIPCCQ